METKTHKNHVNELMKKLNDFPVDLVQIEITQSILSSKLTSIDNEAIEKILNTCLHHIKSQLGNDFENIEIIAYRIDVETSDFFSMDYIHHKIILIGNGFLNKIPILQESINNYVSNKLGDELSIKTSEKQQRDEIYSYVMNQTTSSIRGDRFDELSDKTNTFYHPDLYDFSSKGWIILDPKEINSSFVIFANNK
jgi:hypothetical protein